MYERESWPAIRDKGRTAPFPLHASRTEGPSEMGARNHGAVLHIPAHRLRDVDEKTKNKVKDMTRARNVGTLTFFGQMSRRIEVTFITIGVCFPWVSFSFFVVIVFGLSFSSEY